MDEFLVLLIDATKIVPMTIDIQAYMRDRNTPVVRVLGVVLVDHPHDPTDELDVGGQRTKGLKDRGHAQVGVVESLAKHTDLHNAIDPLPTKVLEHILDGIVRHIAVNFPRL